MRTTTPLLLGCLLLLGLGGRAESAGVSTPNPPDIIEVTAFQNGVYPDPLYTGSSLRGISRNDTSLCLGIAASAADTVALVGSEDGSSADKRCQAFYYCDMSGFRANAVIYRAVLWLFMETDVASVLPVNPNPPFLLGAYRMFWQWGTGTDPYINWGFRKRSATLADSAWLSPGCADTVGLWLNFIGTTSAPIISHITTSAAWPKKGDVAIACGSDTAYSAYSQTSNQGDRTYSPQKELAIGRTGAIAPSWIPIDVTQFVRNWRDGRWANYGIMLQAKDRDANVLRFVTDKASTPEVRPLLVIEYIEPAEVEPDTVTVNTSSGTGGSGRRAIGIPLPWGN